MLDSASQDVLPLSINSTSDTGINFSRTSLCSYISKFGYISDQDFTLIAAYYNEKKNGTSSFSSETVKQYYTDARRTKYSKKQYGKEDGYIAWHGYQSFKPNEITPEKAHEIGLQTAREMWGDKYQIIVTTHLDKNHLHNHFCFNSVSL